MTISFSSRYRFQLIFASQRLLLQQEVLLIQFILLFCSSVITLNSSIDIVPL